jgi:hypothetical protein
MARPPIGIPRRPRRPDDDGRLPESGQKWSHKHEATQLGPDRAGLPTAMPAALPHDGGRASLTTAGRTYLTAPAAPPHDGGRAGQPLPASGWPRRH